MKYFFVVLCLFCFKVYGQDIRIPGQVLDYANTPIQNAEISIVGENSSAVTDATGIFSLIIPKSIKKGDLITIRARKEGYQTLSKHIPVSPLIITLKLIKIIGVKSPAKSPNSEVRSYQAPNTSIQGNEVHSITGNGNIVGVNGNLNINQERHLTEGNKIQALNYIDSLKKANNANVNCFNIGFSNNSNATKLGLEFQEFLKSQGYKQDSPGFFLTMSSVPLMGIQIRIMGNCLEVTVGYL